MRVALLVVLVVGCHGDEPSSAKSRSQAPAPPPPPQFKLNRGREVLDAQHIALHQKNPGGWEGEWTGTLKMTGGIVEGTLPVHMKIRVNKDGTIRLVQDQFGIVVVQTLVPSPDMPGVAAGINYDRRGVGEVSMLTRSEQTAVLSGNHIVIGMYNEIEDAGSYQGQAIPKAPPSQGFTMLARDDAGAAGSSGSAGSAMP